MRQRLKVPALLMCCLALSAASCEKRVATAIPIPPERIDCAVLGGDEARPKIPAEYVIDWSRVTSVPQARTEHDAFVTRLRQRETPVSSEERRVGKECVSSCRSRWSPYH